MESRGVPWGFRLGVPVGLPVARDGGGGPRTAPDLAAPSLTEYSRLLWGAVGRQDFCVIFFYFWGFFGIYSFVGNGINLVQVPISQNYGNGCNERESVLRPSDALGARCALDVRAAWVYCDQCDDELDETEK